VILPPARALDPGQVDAVFRGHFAGNAETLMWRWRLAPGRRATATGASRISETAGRVPGLHLFVFLLVEAKNPMSPPTAPPLLRDDDMKNTVWET